MSVKGFLVDPPGWIPVVISILTGAWAVSSARKDRLVQKRLLSLENFRERDRLESSRRAVISARAEPDGSCTRLFIDNDGFSSARAIEVLVNGHSLRSDRLLARGERVPQMIASKAGSSVLLLTLESTPPSVRLVVTWEDDSGSPGRWETDLTLLRD